jgi:hypothetical protein
MEKYWFDYPFSEIEKTFFILEKAVLPTPNGAFFIELFADESFRIPFRLLLIWETEGIFCQKITLENDNLIEIKTGRIESKFGIYLFKLVTELNVKMQSYKEGQGRDGSIYRLKIGQDSSFLSLQCWDNNLPPGWEAVEIIVNELKKIINNTELIKTDKLSFSMETESEKSILKEEKQLYLSFKKL